MPNYKIVLPHNVVERARLLLPSQREAFVDRLKKDLGERPLDAGVSAYPTLPGYRIITQRGVYRVIYRVQGERVFVAHLQFLS